MIHKYILVRFIKIAGVNSCFNNEMSFILLEKLARRQHDTRSAVYCNILI